MNQKKIMYRLTLHEELLFSSLFWGGKKLIA